MILGVLEQSNFLELHLLPENEYAKGTNLVSLLGPLPPPPEKKNNLCFYNMLFSLMLIICLNIPFC